MRHHLLFCVIGVSCLLAFAPGADSQGKKKKVPIWSENKDAFGDALPVGAIARIGTLRYRLPPSDHPDATTISPDGKVLASLGRNDSIDLWELPAWKKLRSITARSIGKGKQANFAALTFTPDSKQLLTYDGQQRQVLFLDVATGKVARKITLPPDVTMPNPVLQLTRDQQTLIGTSVGPAKRGGEAKRMFFVWDLAGDKLRLSFDVGADHGHGFAIDPAGRWVALYLPNSGGRKNPADTAFIDLLDLATGKPIRKIETDVPIRHLAFSPDGKLLVAATDHAVLRIYNVASGQERHNIRLRRSKINHLQFPPDSTSFWLADMHGQISQWNALTGERLASYASPVPCDLRQFAFLPDGKVLAFGDGLEAIFLWEVLTGKLLSPAQVPTGIIIGLAFTPEGNLFIGAEDGHLALWNPRTGSKQRDLKLELPERKEPDEAPDLSRFTDCNFMLSANGQFMAFRDGNDVGFYDVKTGKLLYDDEFEGADEDTFSFLDQGIRAASVRQKKIRIWNTRTGRDITAFDLPLRAQERVSKFAVTPSGSHFAVATVSDQGETRILLWDANARKLLRESQAPERGESIRCSPDEQWLAVTAGQDVVRLSRLAPGKTDFELNLKNPDADITHLLFSPDSRQLACAAIVENKKGGDAGKIFIYEMASKKIRLELVGHVKDVVEHLAYSHDSSLLASGSMDTTVLVWSAGLRGFAAVQKEDTPAKELETWFDQMAGSNAKVAFQSMIKLAQNPNPTLKLLGQQIEPARRPEADGKTIAQWIQDLGNSQFAIRTRASAALEKLGPSAEPELRAALQRSTDVETKRRIEELLVRHAAREWTAQEILHARAVEVVEAIASPEARALLIRWTRGDPGAILTQHAQRALGRLR